MNTGDDEFAKRSRERLQASVDGLDARIRSRLTQARFAAAEETRKSHWGFAWRTWVPAGGMAAAAVIAMLLWNVRAIDRSEAPMTAATSATSEQSPDNSPVDDLELLVASESFELLEDLEFYEWMESVPGAGDADVG